MRFALPSLADFWKPPSRRHKRARRGFLWCCDCSGSGPGSRSGSESGSRSGSAAGSIPGGACCLDPTDGYGVWQAGNWPASMTATITNACCGAMNQTVTPLTPGFPSGFPNYNSTNSLVYCDGFTTKDGLPGGDANDGIGFSCRPLTDPATGQRFNVWQAYFRVTWTSRTLRCFGSFYHDLTLLSCKPLHLIGRIPVCTVFNVPPSAGCDGTIDVEFSE
jgi:hypothetical protein